MSTPMSTVDLIQLLVAVIGGATLIIRFAVTRHSPRTPASRWLTVVLAAITAAVLIGWPPLMTAVAGDGGGLVALRVLQHGIVLLMGLSLLAFAQYATRVDAAEAIARTVIGWTRVFAVSYAVMAVTAYLGWRDAPGADADESNLLTPEHAATPAIGIYLVAYAAPLAAAMWNVSRRCLVHFRRPEHVMFRVAVFLFFIGSVAGGIYSVLRVTTAILAMLHLGGSGTAMISFAFTVVGMVCVLTGAGIVGVIRAARSVSKRRAARADYHRLTPLWGHLSSPLGKEATPTEKTRPAHLLHLRLVDLGDAIDALGPWLSQPLNPTMSGREALAAIDAALLAREEGEEPEPTRAALENADDERPFYLSIAAALDEQIRR